MKNGLWTKIVIVIITLEILVGAIYYGYKKIVTTDSGSLSTKNKTVTTLYKKIAHEDLEILDVMENKAMLYYAYNNIENKDSISCEVINVNREGYTCSGLTTFVKKEALEKEVKDFKYTPNLKRPICIIDPETTEEVKPTLYFDEKTNEVKGKCKLKPYKSYFAFEIRDKKEN